MGDWRCNTGTLVINEVDLERLEEQRVLLNKVLDRLWDVDAEDWDAGEAKVAVTKEEYIAMAGVVNMLDCWSDERYG